jgi:hypothetical protein
MLVTQNEDPLEWIPSNSTTTGEDIFYEHTLKTLACIVTDEVRAMMGIKNNCVERIKKNLVIKFTVFTV